MRKKIVEPEEPEVPLKSSKALRVVYIAALFVIIGMGVYTLITSTGFGFTMRGRYSATATQMVYGPFEYFMMAGILIFFGFIFWLFDGKKRP